MNRESERPAAENASAAQASAILKKSSGVALATFLSRLMGLIRVRLESAVLGGSGVASVWFLTFMIPNLFRRVLGEGALGTALIPLIAEIERKEGRTAMRRDLAVIFTALGILLALIVILISGVALAFSRFHIGSGISFLQRPYMQGVSLLLPLLMPYAFFICLTGIVTAILNYAKVFMLPALGALLLNIFLIGGLSAAYCCAWEAETLLPVLAILTLISGIIQLLLMLLLLRVCGRFPIFSRKAFADLAVLKKLFFLALPGILGYSALQISFVADRTIAAFIGSQAVPALTYVDRIIDLPIGIFAVSLGSVLMASMARAAVDQKEGLMEAQLLFSLRMVWFICLPMALMVMLFHEPMLRLLCLGGNYTEDDLKAARWVAVFYGAGIPFFCSLKAILPAFYARKMMKTPLIVSLIAIVTNIGLNLLLMFPLKQGGIALATVISSALNNGILLWLLKREGFGLRWKELFGSIIRALMLSMALVVVIYCVYNQWLDSLARSHRLWELLLLMAAGIFFVVGYFVLAWRYKAPECGELLSVLKRRRSAKAASPVPQK